jgi:tRNA-2-methylthio-N6-dimethylallyladenosine synthase
VPHPEKVERMERLLEVVQRRAGERARRFVGRTLEVLVESESRTDATRMRGRTRHNRVVNFAGFARPGELADVLVSEATSQTLVGEERLLGRAQAVAGIAAAPTMQN